MSRPEPVLVRFTELDSPLMAFKNNVTSQAGEDGVIAEIVKRIEPSRRFCIEFGAWDGKHFSNCYDLVANQGWGGLLIEANAKKFLELKQTYASNERAITLNRLVDFDGPNTLDNIVREISAPLEPALVSIDIDGNDYYVFESMVALRPEIVLIEFNPTIPNDVSFVQEKSFDVNHGCSLMALVQLGKTKGYELAACTDCNAFFVRADKYPRLGLKSNFVNKLYRPIQDGRIFQGYDGSIHVVGMTNMIWKGGLEVSSEDFQVLPKAARVWGDAQR
jgi:hypothetical protein